MICVRSGEVILLVGADERTTEPEIIERDSRNRLVVFERRTPGHEVCLLRLPRAEPGLDGKEPPAPGLPGKIGDPVYLVNVVLIGVKVPGEVEDLLPEIDLHSMARW